MYAQGQTMRLRDLVAPVARVPDVGGGAAAHNRGQFLSGLSTATAAEGSFPTGSQDVQPWITRIAPNHGQDQGNVSWPPCREANNCFPLRFNQLVGVRFAAGCWVQGVPSQSSGPPEPGLSTTFFGCCPSDCMCPLRPL